MRESAVALERKADVQYIEEAFTKVWVHLLHSMFYVVCILLRSVVTLSLKDLCVSACMLTTDERTIGTWLEPSNHEHRTTAGSVE